MLLNLFFILYDTFTGTYRIIDSHKFDPSVLKFSTMSNLLCCKFSILFSMIYLSISFFSKQNHAHNSPICKFVFWKSALLVFVNFLDTLCNQCLKPNFIFVLSACFKFSNVKFLSFHGIFGVNILNFMLISCLILKFWVNLCLGSYSSTQWFSTRVHADILYKCFEDGFC